MLDFKFLTLCLVLFMANLEVTQPARARDMPMECADMNPRIYKEKLPDCCKMQNLFHEKDHIKCGFQSNLENFPSLRHCPKFECLANIGNMMKNGEMDPELSYAFLNKFAKKHPSFKTAVANAKRKCIGKPLIGLDNCPPMKIITCMTAVLYFGCPGFQTDPRCDYIKDFMRNCFEYLVH